MNLSAIKNHIIINAKNIPGRNIARKIVVIECDDWGGIRLPSFSIYQRLLNAGIPVDKSRYNRFDTLESKEDLEQLFDILLKVKDKNGNPAKMSPVTNVSNPDFEKIKNCNFEEYFFEKYTDTLTRYGRYDDVIKLWKKGIDLGIFVPELHGREHIAVQLWMNKLRDGDRNILYAFDNEFVSVETQGIHPAVQEFRAEFYFNSIKQKEFLLRSARESVLLFHQIFGFIPHAFVPANAIFHPDFEIPLFNTGVRFLNVNHLSAFPDNNGNIKYKYHWSGQKSKSGLTYYIRNCAFEPTDKSYAGIDLTMKQIEGAFRWHKPAIISTHRVNFMGSIHKKNRDQGLHELLHLLTTITQKWSDVVFMNTAEMLKEVYPDV